MDRIKKNDLTAEELRRLLVEKRRSARQERIEHFRRTGRVVSVKSEERGLRLQDLQTEMVPGEDSALAGDPPRSSVRRRNLDRMLIAIEIAAVGGLVFVLLNGFSMLRNLNQEVAASLRQPTHTPTPLIFAVVLPSGHIPPNQPGGGQPNPEEIPEHLRPLVSAQIHIPIPTPGPEQATRIEIPAIQVDAPVVMGDGAEQLKKGVGQSLSGVNPGQIGNTILSAHNDIYAEIFRNLDQLEPGDEINISTAQYHFTYQVVETRFVEPTAVEVMAPTSDSTVTLISCYPYMVDSQRIVVIGKLV